jgi:hypothetical protein
VVIGKLHELAMQQNESLLGIFVSSFSTTDHVVLVWRDLTVVRERIRGFSLLDNAAEI